MKSVMRYVSQLSKTLWGGQQLISGIGCQPETAFDEFLSTKLLHHKEGGVMFYHMVQSFPKGADVDPRTAHEAARRLAGYFEGCEILVCTHTDREHKSNKIHIPENIELFYIPPYTPEMNPIEQIWKELRITGFRNEVFATLEKVVDRLCDTICTLTSDTIKSITRRSWIINCFN